MSGWPAARCSTLMSEDFIRLLSPAARMITSRLSFMSVSSGHLIASHPLQCSPVAVIELEDRLRERLRIVSYEVAFCNDVAEEWGHAEGADFFEIESDGELIHRRVRIE